MFYDKITICKPLFYYPFLHANNGEMTKQFFNMIAGKDGTACILLYGNIGNYDDIRSGDIVRELLEIEASYDKIDVRINSMGGEVYAGIAIFNALRNSKADITLYIDGIAASIASVIAACGKPVYMSRFARLMLHSVSGGCWGNKEDLQKCINEIDALEETLAEIYATRFGKTKEEIRSTYFDGEEHWFTADEALEAGLIDGIYDTDPIPEDSTPQQVYEIYQNRLNPDKMLIDELKKRPSFVGCAGDEEVLSHIGHLETEAGRVAGLETENTNLKNELKAYKEKEEATAEAARIALVDAAVKDGRIKEPQREVYLNLLKADPVNGEAALKALRPARKVIDDLHTPPTAEGSAWEKRMEEIKNNLKQ